ncbi:MAG: hypothetical protein ACRYFV_07540 [Janthinobacterium lividum]
MVLPWMRRLLIAIGIGLALVVVFAAWMLYISPEARTGSRNRHHAHLVQLGMSQHEALAIIGPPHDVSKYPVDGRMQVNYSYKAGPLASDDIHIMVGPDSLVSYR